MDRQRRVRGKKIKGFIKAGKSFNPFAKFELSYSEIGSDYASHDNFSRLSGHVEDQTFFEAWTRDPMFQALAVLCQAMACVQGSVIKT